MQPPRFILPDANTPQRLRQFERTEQATDFMRGAVCGAIIALTPVIGALALWRLL
ncbi:hypothetical protein [Rhizobium sp. 9140]|uniref:hypothetical protein n=1 Tax=Rhizobium sp. 9140 TaxID=1761900 RepID=UPI000794BF14|nr:hypothetical protein [Rhizobium sp. 9140]CZT36161.1 hypothetical protein GA0004734_00031630 [Rhizobium sp. 9140]